jgi:hypothetical protein
MMPIQSSISPELSSILRHLVIDDSTLEAWHTPKEPEKSLSSSYTAFRTEQGISFLRISPNPANDLIHIGYPAEADGLATLEIHDVLGRVQHRQALTSLGLIELDLSKWSAGLYLISLRAEGLIIDSQKMNIKR